jgi:hypothetical protein
LPFSEEVLVDVVGEVGLLRVAVHEEHRSAQQLRGDVSLLDPGGRFLGHGESSSGCPWILAPCRVETWVD